VKLMPVYGTVTQSNVMTTSAAPSKCQAWESRYSRLKGQFLSTDISCWNGGEGCLLSFLCSRILLNKVIDSAYDDSQWQLTNSYTGKSAGVLKLILHYAGATKTVS
jgi:hypothetical protein